MTDKPSIESPSNSPPGPSQAPAGGWDAKVEEILKKVNRQANLYFGLGMGIYGCGSICLMFLLKDRPMLLTLVVMFFFQLCVVFFGTKAIYPCISGAFRVGLLANRESMPVFERVAAALEGKDGITSRLDQAALDIREAGNRIHGEVKRLADAMERPIVPVVPRPKPQIPAGALHGGNGERSGEER